MQIQQAHYFVYIFGTEPRSTVQIGIVGDLQQQIKQQANTVDNDPFKLIYYEHYDLEEVAVARERHIKNATIDSIFSLIESMNPNWLDLSDTLTD
ncbi:excinuclease ABC subunit C [Pontibacter vulgaris]|uniref:excinuclease ABC subunit C n=1 Tax=Pontibacter vulgaris TaxID=2905679 RepID=UPI001FA78F9E|nr:excinuclease ABC subunit C [Pontibacter vulgaris]